MPQRASRLQYLDGLRGIACMMVVLSHYTLQFFPIMRLVLGVAADGQAAVMLFFLMSGYVLTKSFGNSSRSVAVLAQRRLVRLIVPVLAATVISFLLAAFAQPHLLNRTALLNAFDGHDIFIGFRGGPFGLFPQIPLHQQPNPSLWTISVEIWGSFWMLALVTSRRVSPWLSWLLAAAQLALFGTNFLLLFTIGHLLATLRLPQRDLLGLPALALGVILIYQNDSYMMPPALYCGCTLVVAGLLIAPAAQTLLSRRLPLYLGTISFSIYLIHEPLMFVIARFLPHMSQTPALLCSLAIGIPITLWLAGFFHTLVDNPAITLSRQIGNTTRNGASNHAETSSV